MTAPVFVDTNVLVYRHDSADSPKQARADEWISFLAEQRLARISFQVLQELYVTLTRKLDPGFSQSEAREIARDLYGAVEVIDPFSRSNLSPDELLESL